MYAGATELKERIVEERRARYGERIVRHVNGKEILWVSTVPHRIGEMEYNTVIFKCFNA